MISSAVLDVLVAVVRASTPAGEDGWPAVEETAARERLARQVAALPRDQRRLLALGTRSLRLISRLRTGRSFERLDPERADRLLTALSASRISLLRRLAHVLRMLTRFAYWSGEEAHPVMELDGPWLGRIEVEGDVPPQLGEQAAP